MGYTEYLSENLKVLSELDPLAMHELANFVAQHLDSDSTVWMAGNGGSASTASHAVADLCKTISVGSSNSVRAIALSEMTSLQTAFANDESFESAFGRTIKLMGKPGDLVFMFSVSGTSPNLLELERACRSEGIKTVALVGSKGELLASHCDFGLVIPSADYQVVENAHVFLLHWLVKALSR